MRRWFYAAADVGPSAAASLVVGLLAVRLLGARSLGVYSILYSAAFLCAVAPTQMVFLPFERAAAILAEPVQALRAGLYPAVNRAVRIGCVAALVVLALGGYLYATVPEPSTVLLAAGAAALAVTSPIQDAVRRVAHIVERGTAAVAASFVQLGLMAALAAATLLLLPQQAGSTLIALLAVTNGVSAGVGLVMLLRAGRAAHARAGPGEADDATPPVPGVGPGGEAPSSAAGRYRVVAGLLPDVSFNIGNLLIERLEGSPSSGRPKQPGS